nr:hypothetical protein [Tanacetum cinerariifolium]
MTFTFAETHNMITYLTKSDASEGFNQILDFLNGSSIKYALTVNPNIYVLCIKQFWTTIAVKKVNDVIRLQALVDKKKVVVTEATIREALRLDDAEGVECLPNEEIFVELARIGYEKPSTKLTFYKAFFSSQWKFLIHIILQCMSAKRTSWNEFSSSMAYVVICLSSGRKFNFSKYIFDSLVRNVDSTSKFYMYPRFLQLMIRKQVGDLSIHTTKYTSPALTQKVFANMRRVGKGFSRVETPLFAGMLVEQQVVEEGDVEVHGEEVNVGDTAEGDVTATHGEVPTADEEPFIPSLTPPTPPPQPSHDIPFTSQVQPTPPQSPQHLEFNKVAQALEITKLKRRMKKLKRRNKVRVLKLRQLQKEVFDDAKEVAKDVKVDESADIQGRTAESQAEIYKIDLYHAHKVLSMHEDETGPAESQEVVDVVTTTKLIKENVAGFKMDYFKGMSYDDIRPIFERYFDSNVAFLQKTKEQIEEDENRALKRLNETSAEKAAKRQKLDEEVEELKRHLHIVPNEDDDVYTEATPFAQKVHVVDYQIIKMNNKPYFKIIRADDTHQFQIFMLKSGRIKEVYMVQQRSKDESYWNHVMLNAIRLEVKEESEVSLELLRFTQQQHQEGQLE